MRCLSALSVLLWASLAGAQPAEQSASSVPAAGADRAQPRTETAQEAGAKRVMKLAQILNPQDYAPAFNVGAQAELIVPSIGVSAILVGYDAVWMRTELSLGFGVGDDVDQEQDSRDLYITGLRVAFPVHRGVRSDFSLLVAGGATFIDPPQGDSDAVGSAGAGASFRAFLTPNMAVVGTLGALIMFRGDHWAILGGARPLGSAAVVYFFR